VIKYIVKIAFFEFVSILFNIYRYFFTPTIPQEIREIIILGFGGIGNHVTITPALQSLRTNFPDANIVFFASSKACVDLLIHDPIITSLHIMDIGHMRSLHEYLLAGLYLRKFRPDVVLSAAGTDPFAGGFISFLSGSKCRIGEDWRGKGALYTQKIAVNLKIPESEQNIEIISILRPTENIMRPRLVLTDNEIIEAQNWIRMLNFSKKLKLLGIHPGSGEFQKWKRWDLNNFVKVSEKLFINNIAVPLFFFGPEDKDLYLKLKNIYHSQSHLVMANGSIRKTAAKISCCDLFLSNDSGLRHIAAALGIKTIGIFGPTVREKNFLCDQNNKLIYSKNAKCSPCHYTSWWLSCGEEKPCLRQIPIDEVVKAVSELLQQ